MSTQNESPPSPSQSKCELLFVWIAPLRGFGVTFLAIYKVRACEGSAILTQKEKVLRRLKKLRICLHGDSSKSGKEKMWWLKAIG